jgi:heptosyltransferase I
MPTEFTSPPSRVCVLRLSAIGDTCHAVPVVRALQRAWPQTQITWIIGRTEHGLLRGLGGVEFVVFDKSRGLGGFRELRAQLRGRRYALLLHMHASLRANFASLLVPAQVRLGFDRARARDWQWLVTSERIPPQTGQHVMDGLLEFTRVLGIDPEPLRWELPVSDEDRAFAAGVLDPQQPSLLISPCSGQRLRNYRNWRAERYAQVADYAHSRYGARIVLTGGNTRIERQYGAAITASTGAVSANLIGATTLKQLLALIEGATVLLCPDSGPAHMATAVRTPVVGLYATSNRLRTGPYFSQHLVVDRYPDAVMKEFGVAPEALRFGQRVRNAAAMDLISVNDVIEKLDLAFAGRAVKPLRAAD